jgi:hypothetical protein
MPIEKGDLVRFKKVYSITIEDLARKCRYSKYMLVIEIFSNFKPSKSACKVLCSNGDVNWVASENIEKINLK